MRGMSPYHSVPLVILVLFFPCNVRGSALVDVLLLADQSGVFQVNLTQSDSPRSKLGFPFPEEAFAVGYDHGTQLVFFAGAFPEFIFIGRAAPNGSNHKFYQLSSDSKPISIAPDPNAKVVYYIDSSQPVLGVLTYDMSTNKQLITSESSPNALVLNHGKGKMYFASHDEDNTGTIVEAAMDGSDIRYIYVMPKFISISDLALDVKANELYIISTVTSTSAIASLNLDTRSLTSHIIQQEHTVVPNFLSIAVGENFMYISQQNNKTLLKVTKDVPFQVERVGVTPTDSSLVSDIAVITVSTRLPVTGVCSINNGGCEVFCLANPTGRTCACGEGFELHTGRTCKRNSSPVENTQVYLYLMDSTNGNIYSMDVIKRNISKVPIRLLDNPSACDYDPRTEQLFVLESAQPYQSSKKYVSRQTTDGILKLGVRLPGRARPSGIALDFISNLVYYTDAGEMIVAVVSMDFRNFKTLLYDIEGLTDIALDVYEGKMFLTSHSPPRIISADGNGGRLEIIVTTNLVSPIAIAIDTTEKLIFWLDSSVGLEQSKYSGVDRKRPMGTSATDSYAAMLVDNTFIYLSTLNRLYRLVRSVGNIDDLGPINEITSIADIASGQKYIKSTGTNLCSINNGECSQMCLPTPLGRQCACTLRHTLGTDGRTCTESGFKEVLLMADREKAGLFQMDIRDEGRYRMGYYNLNRPAGIDYNPKNQRFYYADAQYKKLSEAMVDYAWYRTVFTWDGFEYLEDVAVDPEIGLVYVVDSGYRQILEVSPAHNTSSTVLTLGAMSKPRALSLDLFRRHMFWSDIGPEPKIQRVSMGNWTNIETIISDDIGSPNDIVVDVPSDSLFWCDGGKQAIERSTLDGMNRVILFNEPRIYISIAVDNAYLYFSELRGSFISRIDKRTGNDLKTIGDGGLRHVFGMVYVNRAVPYRKPIPGSEGSAVTPGDRHLTMMVNTGGTDTMMVTGIIVGTLVPVVIIVLITVICCCRRKKVSKQSTSTDRVHDLEQDEIANTYDGKTPDVIVDTNPDEPELAENSKVGDTVEGNNNIAFKYEEATKPKVTIKNPNKYPDSPTLEFVRQSRKLSARTKGFGSTTEEELFGDVHDGPDRSDSKVKSVVGGALVADSDTIAET